MTVTLTGSNGLFTRLGKLFQLAERINTHQTDASSGLKAEIEDVLDEYSSGDLEYVQDLVATDEAWQKNAANIFTTIRSIASKTLIGMVDDDVTLPVKSVLEAGKELKRQMETASASIKGNVFSAAVSYGSSNTGTGKGVVSLINGEGNAFQNLRPDTITAVCTRDAQVSGTISREQFTVTKSNPKITDIRDVDWGTGMGLKGTSFSVADPAYSGSSAVGRNALVNGSFNNFTTTDNADNWTAVVGAFGTDFKEEGTYRHLGDKSMKYVGDGSTLPDMKQQLNTSGASTVRLRQEERYMMGMWIRPTSGITGGVVAARLENGSGALLGSTSGDNTTAELSFAVVSYSSASWHFLSTSFSTVKDIPITPEMHLEQTTAINDTKGVYISGFQLMRMPKVGGNTGFHALIVPSDTDWIVDDEITITITKDTTGKFATYLDKFLGFGQLDLQLPFKTDASETVADSLIA